MPPQAPFRWSAPPHHQHHTLAQAVLLGKPPPYAQAPDGHIAAFLRQGYVVPTLFLQFLTSFLDQTPPSPPCSTSMPPACLPPAPLPAPAPRLQKYHRCTNTNPLHKPGACAASLPHMHPFDAFAGGVPLHSCTAELLHMPHWRVGFSTLLFSVGADVRRNVVQARDDCKGGPLSQILSDIFVRNLFDVFTDLHGDMLGCPFAHLYRQMMWLMIIRLPWKSQKC